MSIEWYRLSPDFSERTPRPLMVTSEARFSCDYVELCSGVARHDWDSNASVRSKDADHDGPPDDYLGNSLMIPILSQRLREALEKAGVAQRDIQYLPVHVYQSTGVEVAGYAIANITARVPALDREHSEMLNVRKDIIDPLTGRPEVASVWQAALCRKQLEGHDGIRLTEFWPPVFVSSRFVELYAKLRCTGALFSRVVVS